MFIFQNNGKGKSKQSILYRIEDINLEKKKKAKKYKTWWQRQGPSVQVMMIHLSYFNSPLEKKILNIYSFSV